MEFCIYLLIFAAAQPQPPDESIENLLKERSAVVSRLESLEEIHSSDPGKITEKEEAEIKDLVKVRKELDAKIKAWREKHGGRAEAAAPERSLPEALEGVKKSAKLLGPLLESHKKLKAQVEELKVLLTKDIQEVRTEYESIQGNKHLASDPAIQGLLRRQEAVFREGDLCLKRFDRYLAEITPAIDGAQRSLPAAKATAAHAEKLRSLRPSPKKEDAEKLIIMKAGLEAKCMETRCIQLNGLARKHDMAAFSSKCGALLKSIDRLLEASRKADLGSLNEEGPAKDDPSQAREGKEVDLDLEKPIDLQTPAIQKLEGEIRGLDMKIEQVLSQK